MKNITLDKNEKEFFFEKGYLVMENILDEADLQPVIEEINDEIDIRARKLQESGKLSNLHEDKPFETRLAGISQETAKLAVSIWGGILHGPAIFHLITNSKLLDVAESFCGEEVIASSVYRLRPKIPNFGYGEVPAHQDSGYFEPFCDDDLVLTMWIPLVDTYPENGCLWVIPGSHRPGRIYPTADHGQPDEFDPTDEAYGFDDSGAVPVEVKAGAVVFFNGYLLHRSHRNRSDGTRMALVNHYMNAWSPLPWMLEHGIDVGTNDNRRVTMIRGTDPYADTPIVEPPEITFVRAATGRSAIDDPLHIDTSVTIAAPIDVVWATLNDLGSYGDWNPYIIDLSGTGEPGTTVTVTSRPGGGDDMSYDVDVVSADSPRQLRWNGGFPDRSQWDTDHRWDLTETDHHTTVVRHHERFSGTLADDILAANGKQIRSDFKVFNEALKAEAERRFEAG